MMKEFSSSINSRVVLFIVNLIFGLLFILAIFLLEKTSIVEELYNYQLDIFVNRVESNKKIDNGNLVFYELNNTFFEEYNATTSSITPRDGIAKILKKLEEQKPKVIFLDLFLFNNKELDKNLTKTLKSILQNKESKTKFIFPVKKYMTTDGENKVLYPYFRGELKKFENKKLFYGISNLYGYEDTLVKRYFDFNETIDGVKFYNIPLLAELLMEDKEEIIRDKNISKVPIKEHTIDLSTKDTLIKNRINFYIFKGWQERGEELNSKVRISNEILEDNNYTNKLLFIGVNRPLMGDVHKTPIGKMSGVYLLGNAYLTLNNPIEKASKWLTWSILLIIILLMSYLLTLFDSIVSVIIMSISVAIVLYLLSSWLYLEHGIFISMIIPLFYISKHGDFAELLESIVQKGLSWIEYKLEKRENND